MKNEKHMRPFFRISRGNDWYGKSTPLDIYIDGIKVGSVFHNDYDDFLVSPGFHEIYVKMDWYKSAPYKVEMVEGYILNAMIALDVIMPRITMGSVMMGYGILEWFRASVLDGDNFFVLKPSPRDLRAKKCPD
ncbi:hypothetical protein [Spirosoma sordidisoli]|uniref:PEGA domain-containing protein n=1 Tax=Spirosoma sordidisoli TaxID=2502893 RepID=A0A4Q2UG87_9BACT|nr:hypothetical protein [Spirosoma sordidisoli]RYC66260.1 hypothetical protein EQG79_30625 [Spirosoma sordidisoli]